MKEEPKPIMIPEGILNEIQMHKNQISDLDRELIWIQQKRNLANAKMWGIINEKVPETRGVNCRLDMEKKEIHFSPSGLGGLLGKLFSGDGFNPF